MWQALCWVGVVTVIELKIVVEVVVVVGNRNQVAQSVTEKLFLSHM